MLLPVLLDKDSHFIYCYDGLTPLPDRHGTVKKNEFPFDQIYEVDVKRSREK